MINSAAILAGGSGTRLGNLAEGRPKGFLTLGRRPIIEESIEKLLHCGIAQIVIGTGFGARYYDRLAERYPQVHCVLNVDYERSGSMYTLYQLRDLLSERFLLLESDIVYERAALEAVIQSEHDVVVLASGPTDSGDEVFIEADDSSNLIAMSKARDSLSRVDAELVGISGISSAAYSAMCGFADGEFERTLDLDYEHALVGIARDMPVRVLRLDGLAWAEIDDESHLRRVREVVYPEIQRREALA